MRLYAPYRQAVPEMTQDYFTEKYPALTERETEIARLVAQGLSSKEIGARLFITQNTVKTRMKRIFEKRGIRSREMLRQSIQSRKSFGLVTHPCHPVGDRQQQKSTVQ